MQYVNPEGKLSVIFVALVPQDVSAPPVRPAESTPVEEPVSGNKIVIHYASGWSDAFVHYNADKKGIVLNSSSTTLSW